MENAHFFFCRLSSHSVDINIRFKSINSDGLLLWLGKDGMTPGDTFMALAIEEGLLTFRYISMKLNYVNFIFI